MLPAAVLQIDQRTVSLSESCIDPPVWSLANLMSVERSPESRPDCRQGYFSPRLMPKAIGVSQHHISIPIESMLLSKTLISSFLLEQLTVYIIYCGNSFQTFVFSLHQRGCTFDISSLKIYHLSLSTNHTLVRGDSVMRREWRFLTWGDNRWPVQQDNPSLVWTLRALRLKQHFPGSRLSGIDGEEGPNLPWQTCLIPDAILPSLFHGTMQTLWE